MAEEQAASITAEERKRRWEMAYAPRTRPIVPGLVLGNVRASFKRDLLRDNRINAIVSLTDARWTWWGTITRDAGVPQHRHKWVQCVDSSTQDLLAHMSDICDFIDQMASPALSSSLSLPVDDQHDAAPSEAILIHCDLGISRSPTVIIAYLMRRYRLKRAEALAFVQTKQRVKPSANMTRQLQVWEDEERTVAKAPYQEFLDDRAALLKKKGLTGNEPLAPLTL